MAEKDDEVTPFDDKRWVDRDADDDAPPWLEDDDEDIFDSSPAADDPWAAGSDDWRDHPVDEPAPETDPLVDRDDDNAAGFSAGEHEGPPPGAAPAASGPGLSDRDDAHAGDRPVDRDDPAGDALNVLAERELAALGDDRYPLDDDDGEDSDAGDDDTIAGTSVDDSDADIDSDTPAPWHGTVDRDDEPARTPLVDSDEDAAPFAAAAPPAGRRWPLALLAMGGLALILVAVGGYGVIAERAALREEIRDLQARLATAASAPPRARPVADTAATPEQLADLEDRLAALAQENSALRARIGDLKGRLDAANGGGAPIEAPEDTEAAARERQPAPAPPPEKPLPAAPEQAAAAPAPAGETWFVNFSSYAELGTARRRAAELSVDAGRVVVQDAVANGRTIYRVRVVGVGSRDEADAVARRLAATYQLPPLWVGRE